MPRTYDVGPFFSHRLDYPTTEFPLVDVGTSQETDYPFRIAKSLVFRCPFTRSAIVVGKWGKPADDPDSALLAALKLFTGDDDVVPPENTAES